MRKLLMTATTLGLLASMPAIGREKQENFGGGPLAMYDARARRAGMGDCITPAERALVEQNIAHYHATYGHRFRGKAPDGERALYAFFPQAGTLYEDLFLGNFVDLDPGGGIRDWDCTDWTYDGHRGHDSGPASFAEQEIGVPIFAALDGEVVDARDGEFDRHIYFYPGFANYVILFHGGTHYSFYWHLKRGSVAVQVGDFVAAGTQLGLTASSGTSSGPHLHFESHFAGQPYEPFAGTCRPGPSYWVNQPAIRRDLYLSQFNLSDAEFHRYPGLPWEMPRKGSFVQSGEFRSVGAWTVAHNVPANSTWRLRYLRPDGTLHFDSGNQPFNNPVPYRWAHFWFRYILVFNVAGTWRLEFRINDQALLQAPFDVVGGPAEIVNRPPAVISVALQPQMPTASDVLFCRLTSPLLLTDPDYDVVRYRYEWFVNDEPVRDVTSAARSDTLPSGQVVAGDVARCVVTPTDGLAAAPSTSAQVTISP